MNYILFKCIFHDSHNLDCVQATEQFTVNHLQSSKKQNIDYSAKSWQPLQAYSNFIIEIRNVFLQMEIENQNTKLTLLPLSWQAKSSRGRKKLQFLSIQVIN